MHALFWDSLYLLQTQQQNKLLVVVAARTLLTAKSNGILERAGVLWINSRQGIHGSERGDAGFKVAV